MNLDIIKEKLSKRVNQNVVVTVRGMRNKKQIYEGKIYKLYPNIFSIMTTTGEKSFSYADIATKEILLKYQ